MVRAGGYGIPSRGPMRLLGNDVGPPWHMGYARQRLFSLSDGCGCGCGCGTYTYVVVEDTYLSLGVGALLAPTLCMGVGSRVPRVWGVYRVYPVYRAYREYGVWWVGIDGLCAVS